MDVAADKNIASSKSKFESFTQGDAETIQAFEKQLVQGMNNVKQGEMGQALAVAKLTSIKMAISQLEANFKQESIAITNQTNSMLQKHTPSEIDLSQVIALETKAKEVISQMEKINLLE